MKFVKKIFFNRQNFNEIALSIKYFHCTSLCSCLASFWGLFYNFLYTSKIFNERRVFLCSKEVVKKTLHMQIVLLLGIPSFYPQLKYDLQFEFILMMGKQMQYNLLQFIIAGEVCKKLDFSALKRVCPFCFLGIPLLPYIYSICQMKLISNSFHFSNGLFQVHF